MNIPSGYKLVLEHSGRHDATAAPTTLPGYECDAVVLSVCNTEDDGQDTLKTQDGNNLYDESGEEAYWGHGHECGHQIFPKETSMYIGVDNARDVSVRANKNKAPAPITIFYSCFVLKPIKGAN